MEQLNKSISFQGISSSKTLIKSKTKYLSGSPITKTPVRHLRKALFKIVVFILFQQEVGNRKKYSKISSPSATCPRSTREQVKKGFYQFSDHTWLVAPKNRFACWTSYASRTWSYTETNLRAIIWTITIHTKHIIRPGNRANRAHPTPQASSSLH